MTACAAHHTGRRTLTDRERLLADLSAVVGPGNVIADEAAIAPFAQERRGRYASDPLAVVRPGSTGEVAALVRLCGARGVAIVPQGGNTGLTGATVAGPQEIILQLGRMRRIRSVDPENFSMEVEAGAVLTEVQQAAADHGCLFPLSLAAEGSCQIGGNLSTNAGGVSVLHYGNSRDLVLGIEIVLADGRVWDGLSRLRKDNTGYDMKHLFIGAEGTLGIVTAAILRLFPAHRRRATAWVALTRAEEALALLECLEESHHGAVTALELVPRIALDMVLGRWPDLRDPLPGSHSHYVLIELASAAPGPDLAIGLAETLAPVAGDAVIATSEAQARSLWELRERISDAQGHFGGSIKHDVAVPRSRIPAFLAEAAEAAGRAMPGVRVVAFGHLGDGNLHYNLSQPPDMAREAFLARWEEMNRIVHDLVARHGGSIAAEHGIGLARREELARYAAPIELDLMRRLKDALDPDHLLNPGKVIDLGPARRL